MSFLRRVDGAIETPQQDNGGRGTKETMNYGGPTFQLSTHRTTAADTLLLDTRGHGTVSGQVKARCDITGDLQGPLFLESRLVDDPSY